MMETRVRVIAATETQAWVVASERSGCGACQSKAHCGLSGLGRYFSRRRMPVQIEQSGARCGDELGVRVNESELLRAGLFAYLLPVLLAVLAATWADTLAAGDLMAVLAAAGGLLAGLVGARWCAPIPRLHPFALSSSSLPPGAPHD